VFYWIKRFCYVVFVLLLNYFLYFM